MVEVGTVYRNSIGDAFTVTDMYNNSRGTWVTYSNNATKQQYECLVEAFVSRFSACRNRRYGR